MPMDLSALPDTAQRIVAEIAEYPKLVAIYLFGSWARGEQMRQRVSHDFRRGAAGRREVAS